MSERVQACYIRGAVLVILRDIFFFAQNWKFSKICHKRSQKAAECNLNFEIFITFQNGSKVPSTS